MQFSVQIDNSFIIQEVGTSEGTQVKYLKDGYWYKKDNEGHEGKAEYLVSHMLQYSSLAPDEYVKYEEGSINGKEGCRSRNFLPENMDLVTLYRLYYNEYGRKLNMVTDRMDTMEERIRYTVRFIKECCDLDIIPYFRKIFTLDMLILNEDRHYNNIALLFDGERFRPAPIFDNGKSLLTANRSIHWSDPLSVNVRKVVARPFSGSHEKMQSYFGRGFTLDVDGALKWLKKEPVSNEKQVLEYQLRRYRDMLSQENHADC